jgi:hypothetical protein
VRPARQLLLLAGALAVLGPACLFTAAGGFAGARDENVCDSTIPVCNTTGGCVLDEDHYLKGEFPGTRRFVVRTHGEAKVKVRVYFDMPKSPGADTNIYVYESGCVERFAFETAGRDIFREAGPDQEFSWETKVYQEGDHLVEINSDAVSSYYLRVDVEELGQ